MAQISLHDYLQQIETLLEDNRLSETIAHCRHILQKFPRHVETYRLYGKALLEQQKYDDAVDIFHRVLSADPEDFIAHVVLAITHKEKGEVLQAIWHMERAFEMDPYNGAIQEELRELYAHRDGLRPQRINLTRGALARLYFRGNLYQQAAAELRQLLAEKGDRLDLQTLLAETLWRDDQRVDVVDVCLRVLDRLPNCIKANAILAEVWLVTGRSDEAQEYLQRLRALTRPSKRHLDPDSVIGRAFSTNGVIDLPEEVLIEELDYIPVAQEFGGEADWVKELGVSGEDTGEVSWLDEIEQSGTDLFGGETPADSDEDMLDWLREVAVAEGDPFAEPGGLSSEDAAFGEEQAETFDWFADSAETSREALEDVPDWLSEVTASAEADMWDMAIEANEGQVEEYQEESIQSIPTHSEMPDWMNNMDQESADFDSDLSWLQDRDSASVEEGGETRILDGDEVESFAGDSEMPDWLFGTDDSFEEPATGSGELSWLSDQADDEEAFPDWSSKEMAYETTGEELPDWLTGSGGSEEPESEMDFESLPDWASEETTFQPAGEELPDWLTSSAESEEPETELDFESLSDWSVEDMSSEEEDEESLDWLAEMEEPETEPDFGSFSGDWTSEQIASPVEEQELPDWLTGFAVQEEGEIEPDRVEVETDIDSELDWLDEPADFDLIVGKTDVDRESLPDWLNQEEEVREEVLMGISEDPEHGQQDIPEDLDEAMKWLEELAAEQGADLAELPSLQKEKSTGSLLFEDEELTPVSDSEEPVSLEELSSLDESVSLSDDDVPDWLKADLAEGDLPADDDLPDWLKEETASMVGGDWLDLSGEESLSDLEMATFDSETFETEALAEPSDDIPDWLRAQMPADLKEDVPEIESEEDLSWLEQIAAGEGAAIEELPTLSWDEEGEDAAIELEGGDLAWLDDLVKTEAFSEETIGSDSLDLFAETPDDLLTEVPDDPDEAMAWLEQLAAQQGAPLDELPTIDELPEMAGETPVGETPVGEAPVGETPADEMPEIDLEAPTLIDVPEEVAPEAGLEVLFESAAESVGETSGYDVPDDPDEAMAWLEQLAAQQGAPLEELPTVHEAPVLLEEPAAAEMPELELQPEIEPELVFEEEVDPELEMALADLSDIDMPEDDDEALAWLEAFAGGDDFGSVEEPDAFVEEAALIEPSLEMLPESDSITWLDDVEDFLEPDTDVMDEGDQVEEFSSADLFEETVEESEESLFAAFETEADQFVSLEADSLADIEQDFVDDELAASLPDWLSFEPMGETSSEELDWLDTFGESDIDSWLVAEEQVTHVDIPVPVDTGELQPLAFQELESVTEVEDISEPEEMIEFEPEAVMVASGPMDKQQLESARSALEIGDYEAALEKYNALLNAGQGLSLLISDLETASTRYTHHAPLRRLLGDAYMRNGQLQKALDTYRQALDQL